ncbi:uncharacterized protein [Asterias amurensis]|uniref:uncharacterized protein isoform X2 n=1 Tax=Asterias amurensis TaxID=7602 RepID=UPI003AB66273
MSIETLLEAAKFVEWSAQIGYGARADDDDVQTGGKNGQTGSAKGGATQTGLSSSPLSSPGSSSPVVSSGKHNDEGDDKRSGTREVHNKLEKNRRAHLKECFDNLRETIPNMDDKKMKPSNLSILQGALRYLQALKRKERDLEYETEKLARQKIQYQDKLIKLKGSYSHWKMEKSLKVEEKDDEREEDMETDEEDRDSVSTSTSTASEAEEEERKSRAQSPELKIGHQVLRKTDPADQKVEPTLVRTDQSSDHFITSGPFVISRRIVTHVPITTTAGQQPVPPAHVPIVVKQHSEQGVTEKKVGTQPKNMTLPPSQFQPKPVTMPPVQFQQQPRGIGGIRQPIPTAAKEYATPQDPTRVAPPQLTRRQVVTQFMIRPQIRRATSQKMVTTTQKLVVTTQSTALQPVLIHDTVAQSQPKAPPLTTAQPVITPQTTAKQIVAPLTADQMQQQSKVPTQTINSAKPKVTPNQVIRHSTAVSAVQEHLKNKAQSKQFNQQQKESSAVSHTAPTMDPLTSKLNVTIATTTAVATVTTAGGIARQTVSQLLGKQQAMVVRHPVRRTDNKFVMQRVTRHPFSPRSQTVDIMPKTSKLVTISSDTSATQVSYTLSKPVTSKEPQTVHVTSAMTSTVSVSGSGAVANVVNTIPTCSVALQHATPPPGLDVRSFIAGHNTMLPSFQHYLPQGGLGAAMIRPNLSNPGMLTAANAALLSQAMLANTRSLAPDLTNIGVNDKNQVRLHSPLTSQTPFLSPSMIQQARVSGVAQGTLPSPSHVAPINQGHSFISPGLTLQPALTQVLFTQPPIAAYTVANSSHQLVNPSLPHTVIRHPLVPTAGIPQNMTTVCVAGTSVPQTTVGVTLPPVVTIGAVAYPMLNTNRAVVTAPTYTTLSFGPFPQYRFPFTNQVPLISPVALTSSHSGVPVGVPATSATNQIVSNGQTSNGVIVHALPLQTTTPVSNAWLNSSTISNGLPTKGLPFPITTAVVTSSTSAVAIATTPSAVTQPSSSTMQEARVTNSQVAATTT